MAEETAQEKAEAAREETESAWEEAEKLATELAAVRKPPRCSAHSRTLHAHQPALLRSHPHAARAPARAAPLTTARFTRTSQAEPTSRCATVQSANQTFVLCGGVRVCPLSQGVLVWLLGRRALGE